MQALQNTLQNNAVQKKTKETTYPYRKLYHTYNYTHLFFLVFVESTIEVIVYIVIIEIIMYCISWSAKM